MNEPLTFLQLTSWGPLHATPKCFVLLAKAGILNLYSSFKKYFSPVFLLFLKAQYIKHGPKFIQFKFC